MTRRASQLLAARRRRCDAPSAAASALARRGDAGFGLVEMMVTLLIMAIIVPIAYSVIRGVIQQSTNVHDTVASLQQDQLAGQSLVQNLQTAYAVDPSSTASSLTAYLEAGYDSTNATAKIASLSASCTMVNATNGIGKLVISLAPYGGTSSSTDTYYVQSPTCSLFQYGSVQQSQGTSTFGWSSTPSSSTIALKVAASLLPGQYAPTEGAANARPSTLATTVYFQNASAVPFPSTSVNLTWNAPATVGSPVTLMATVVPSPDAGAVAFTVTQTDGTQIACPASGLSSGQATCSFTPGAPGSFTAYAKYSGDQGFQPSTSSTVTVAAAYATTTALPSSKPAASGSPRTITITASVATSATGGPAPAGTVQFTVTQGTQSNGGGYQTTVHCNGGSDVINLTAAGSGSLASCVVPVASNDYYSVSAAYNPDSSGNFQSSSATLPSPWGKY